MLTCDTDWNNLSQTHPEFSFVSDVCALIERVSVFILVVLVSCFSNLYPSTIVLHLVFCDHGLDLGDER